MKLSIYNLKYVVGKRASRYQFLRFRRLLKSKSFLHKKQNIITPVIILKKFKKRR